MAMTLTSDTLLARGALYHLLALGFAYPDDAQRRHVAELAVALVTAVEPLDPQWRPRLDELSTAWGHAAVTDLEADFNRLFSGSMECPPHETSFERDGFAKQHVLADIAGFHLAFGFELPEGSRWQHDDLGVELEFCSLLLQRTAYALDEDLPDRDAKVEVCEQALRTFLAEHLGRWVRSFTTELEAVAHEPAYRVLAARTREWVETELRGLGATPDFLVARPGVAPDDAPPECAGCPAVE